MARGDPQIINDMAQRSVGLDRCNNITTATTATTTTAITTTTTKQQGQEDNIEKSSQKMCRKLSGIVAD